MKLSKIYLPRFISAAELEKPLLITIRTITFEKVINLNKLDPATRKPTEEEKPVLYPTGAKRGLVLNKTGVTALIQMFGDVDTAELTGRVVVMYPCKHRSGKDTICLRAPTADETAKHESAAAAKRNALRPADESLI
jgi:hypothetical protein